MLVEIRKPFFGQHPARSRHAIPCLAGGLQHQPPVLIGAPAFRDNVAPPDFHLDR